MKSKTFCSVTPKIVFIDKKIWLSRQPSLNFGNQRCTFSNGNIVNCTGGIGPFVSGNSEAAWAFSGDGNYYYYRRMPAPSRAVLQFGQSLNNCIRIGRTANANLDAALAGQAENERQIQVNSRHPNSSPHRAALAVNLSYRPLFRAAVNAHRATINKANGACGR